MHFDQLIEFGLLVVISRQPHFLTWIVAVFAAIYRTDGWSRRILSDWISTAEVS